ncbi:MAG: hypothetical protein U0163_08150 [Gemmatimonadaceae bacterium]
MNLGGSPPGAVSATQLVHVVFDNESLLSVGGFPTATSTGSDTGGHGRCGRRAAQETVGTVDGFVSAFDEALAVHDLTTLVAKVEAVGPSGYVTDLALLENRFQFPRALRAMP